MTYEDADVALSQWVELLYHVIDSEGITWLEELVAEGRSIINEAIYITRKMIREQGNIPIIEAYNVDHYGNIIMSLGI